MATSRAKGSRFEREVATVIRSMTGLDIARNLEQTRDGGHDLNGIDGWCIECKYRSRAGMPEEAWWNQCVKAAVRSGRMPAVIFRTGRSPIMVWSLMNVVSVTDTGPDYPAITSRVIMPIQDWAVAAGLVRLGGSPAE